MWTLENQGKEFVLNEVGDGEPLEIVERGIM